MQSRFVENCIPLYGKVIMNNLKKMILQKGVKE